MRRSNPNEDGEGKKHKAFCVTIPEFEKRAFYTVTELKQRGHHKQKCLSHENKLQQLFFFINEKSERHERFSFFFYNVQQNIDKMPKCSTEACSDRQTDRQTDKETVKQTIKL
jgi:hypothetical protein